MKKKLALIASIATVTIFCYFYFQSPKTLNTDTMNNVLVVGTSADYPPYAQIDLTTGQIIGFEIDIVNEIAQRLNKKVILRDMPFNSLIVELAAGQIDLIAAGLTPSEERAKTVLFSHPYIDNDDIVAVSKKSNPVITSLQDLYGKSVAVNTGYTSDSFLSKYPEIELVRLKSTADGVLALQADSVYAFATSKSSFNVFIEKQDIDHDYQFFNLPASADACALAFEKNNKELQGQIDPIIDAMIEDGTMQIIKKKWGFE